MRVFCVYIAYSALLAITIGFILGIVNIENSDDKISKASKAGLYGVSIVFFIEINNHLQFFLRQMAMMESLMLSVERAFVVKELKPEK